MLVFADNFQITHPVIESAVRNQNAAAIKDLVRSYQAAGAHGIDINTGPLTRHGAETMTFLVETIQEETDLPVLIDTVNAKAMEAGLSANKKTVILNGFSLEPHKLEKILPLAKRFDASIVGYLLYPDGHVPPDAPERMAVAVELYHHVRVMDMDPAKLIIDPVVVPLLWQNGSFQAGEILSVIRNLPDLLDFPVKTIVGLSNLTAGKADKDKKQHMENIYLSMLACAGLDMALLNIFHQHTVKTAATCNHLLNPGVFSWEEIRNITPFGFYRPSTRDTSSDIMACIC
jgi:5-methyltetrahydrofolate corrinoid/iron sulfur protein methyltransferase